MTGPRVAICGFAIECNRFAPVSTREDFMRRGYWAGEPLVAEAKRAAPAIAAEIPGFVQAMDAGGAWEPVPLVFTFAEPGGPVDQAFFEEFLADLRERLAAAGKLDAVYVCEHGAALTTAEHDPDGRIFGVVREAVGPGVPVVATLDLHANVS